MLLNTGYGTKYSTSTWPLQRARLFAHDFCGARRSPEFPVIAPQNAGLERESYPASDTIRGQRRYFPTHPKLATSRRPPQYCAGATFVSDTVAAVNVPIWQCVDSDS